MFEWMRENENNFSKWYPKIKDCGIRQPKTAIFDVPDDVIKAFYMEHQVEDTETVYTWVKDQVMANLPDDLRKRPIFVKNSVYSNKFNFKSCAIFPEVHQLTTSLIDINYSALTLGADGSNEAVIRERIFYDRTKTPCIYNGMPLRNEFRVFYDFDAHKVLYTVNYWDYDYCSQAIEHIITDKIIFDAMRYSISQGFSNNVAKVEALVDEHMKSVDLKGKWSIDILKDESDCFWLIDMALAANSTYWSVARCRNEDNAVK